MREVDNNKRFSFVDTKSRKAVGFDEHEFFILKRAILFRVENRCATPNEKKIASKLEVLS